MPSLLMPCSKHNCFQNSIPIWFPHCPTCRVIISRGIFTKPVSNPPFRHHCQRSFSSRNKPKNYQNPNAQNSMPVSSLLLRLHPPTNNHPNCTQRHVKNGVACKQRSLHSSRGDESDDEMGTQLLAMRLNTCMHLETCSASQKTTFTSIWILHCVLAFKLMFTKPMCHLWLVFALHASPFVTYIK